MHAPPGDSAARRLVRTARFSLDRQTAPDGTSRLVQISQPGHEEVARRAGALLGALRPDAAPPWCEVVEDAAGVQLVFEDTGGTPLSALLGTLDTERFLRVALAVAQALARLHDAGLVHRAIRPEALLVDQASDRAWVLGFVRALHGTGTAAPRALTALDDDLPWLSPEQTGRMNRSVDARADLYALGCTLHALATGQPPFEATDAMGWVHAHIARRPPTLDMLPATVGAVVARLLAKSVEDRYQTAAGAAADLQRCLDAWRTDGLVPDFALGRADVSPVLNVPERLYGREAERNVLLAACGRVRAGAVEVVLVAGAPGIGKSRLIDELYRPLTEQRVRVLAGKADPFSRAKPYEVLVQAVRAEVRRLLSLPEAQLAAWRVTLGAALGDAAGVVVDVVPELVYLLGPQPTPASLGGLETQSRFRLLLVRLVRALGEPEQPLVLLLDDLQWFDEASLAVLEHLVVDRETRSLYLVCALRGPEADDREAVRAWIEAVGSARPLHRLELGPLDADAVTALVRETVRGATGAEELAALVAEKTGGNPFFVGRFLRTLEEDGLLRFDRGAASWTWDSAAIAARSHTENVLSLMADRMQRFEACTRGALEVAACVGGRFAPSLVARVLGRTTAEIEHDLAPAVALGLVAAPDVGSWRFAHDRVHEAARALLDEAARRPVHRVLARALSDAPEADPRLFDAAEHYAAAGDEVTDVAERARAATLCLAAGQRARDAGAFDVARTHLQAGLDFAAPEAWRDDYALMRDLHVGLAEVAAAAGDSGAAFDLGRAVLDHAATVLDRVRIHELRIDLYEARLEHGAAIDEALEVLELLGVSVDVPPDEATLMGRVQAMVGRLFAVGPEALAELPEATDPQVRAASRILNSLYSTTNIGRPTMLVPVLLRALELVLDHGLTPHAVAGFTQLGAVLCSVGAFEPGYVFGVLGERLRDRWPPTGAATVVQVQFPAFVQHWKEPVRAVVDALERAAAASLEQGNPASYGFCANQLLVHQVLSGSPLPACDARYENLAPRMRQAQQHATLAIVEAWGQLVACLRGEADDPAALSGARCDYDAFMARFEEADLFLGLGLINAAQVVLAGIMRDTDRVLRLADLGPREPLFLVPPTSAFFMMGVRGWYRALAHLDRCRGAEADPVGAVAATEADHERLKAWTAQAPHNHAHRVTLLEAEIARVQGRCGEATRAYEQSAKEARANGFVQDEALALELAADFHREAGRPIAARAYGDEAAARWRAWGATAKAARLGASGTVRATASLDVETVLRISEAVAGEVELERLLDQVLRTVLQSAGAQRAFLFLDVDGALRLQARGVADESGIAVLEGTPVDACAGLVPEIVHFVARSGETVLLHDAARGQRFAEAPALRRDRPRSILCVALGQRGRQVGVLYLGNDLAAGAFTEDRVELLRVFAALAATSIANAMLLHDAKASQVRTEAQNERLIALDRQRESFLARTSHELRTPLNAIIGLTESVLDAPEAPPTPSAAHDLGLVVSSARRLANLIDDLLDSARLSEGQLRVVRGAVDARDAVLAVVQLLRPLVRDGVVLIEHVDGDMPPVLADPQRLEQVLTVLVDNAIKFTRQGSIQVGAELTVDGDVEFYVEDTGVGIDQTAQGRIFDAFVQADERVARTYGGTGLGLSIARQLLDLHESRMVLGSAPGRGARFSFRLPVARGVEAMRAPSALGGLRRVVERDTTVMGTVVASSDEGRGFNVLVVDDEPANLQVVLNRLARLGYSVTTALSGPEALEHIDTGTRPHMVLLDVMMPEMDGLEVCRRLRALYARTELPILMLTARNEVPDLVAGLDAGANDYLGKPFSAEELQARMRTHLHLATMNRSVARFVPGRFLELLGRDSVLDVRLGDAIGRDMTVLFADLKRFSALTGGLDPSARFRLLNEHLAALEPVVLEHGGVVDKFIGDSVMAVFDRRADDAVAAGIAMLRRVAAENERRALRGEPPIDLGIGVNSGPLMLGTVGTEHRMDTTVISDAVGVAHRVETLTRPYGSGLLLTAATLGAMADPDRWSMRLLDRVIPAPGAAPMDVYEVYDAEPIDRRAAKDATRKAFERGVRAFHDRAVGEAAGQFRLCAALDGADGAVQLYLDRCRKIEAQFQSP